MNCAKSSADEAFQFAHPVGGATTKRRSRFPRGNVSIRAPRRGRDEENTRSMLEYLDVSIRAPRRGRDSDRDAFSLGAGQVSIRAPRRGRD